MADVGRWDPENFDHFWDGNGVFSSFTLRATESELLEWRDPSWRDRLPYWGVFKSSDSEGYRAFRAIRDEVPFSRETRKPLMGTHGKSERESERAALRRSPCGGGRA